MPQSRLLLTSLFTAIATLGPWAWATESAPSTASPSVSATAPPPRSDPAAPVTSAAATPAAKPWWDSIKFEAFIDAYGSLNYNFPKPQANSNSFRAFDNNNGFSLAWVGLDLTHEAQPVGGTLSLRFGPAAHLLAGGGAPGTDSTYDLQNVRQAFATYKPWKRLSLDFGKFDTIVGAEVSDSHKNMNYTRGVLYWLAQPAVHTGLRASWQATDLLSVKLLAVNGWNRTIDNNTGKTIGAQVGLTPSNKVAAFLTYFGGPEQDEAIACSAGFAYRAASRTCDVSPGAPATVHRNNGANKRWRHLLDLVVNVNPTEALSIALNGDLGVEKIIDADGRDKTAQWMGASVASRYAFSEVFAAALRGEWYRDRDAITAGVVDAQGRPVDLTLRTGTLTLEVKPSPWMIVRLDNRIDSASRDVFRKAVNEGTSRTQVTSLLGVVLTTGQSWQRGQ
jgi:transposase InsO family protein